MCGIAGIIRFSEKTSHFEIKKMTDAIAHRGPDDEGCWMNTEGNVALGHRRLAIIDLSDHGKQPMTSENGRFVITYNGEIYNYIELRESLQKKGHRFFTTNDIEVLLKLYELKGKDFLHELDGMFAFAIWDNEKKELFCARDRFGEKPFFYHFNQNFFCFASEMKALWQIGVSKEINEVMAYNYEFFGYKTNPTDHRETFFKNSSSLPAGHYMIYHKKNIELKRYYSVDFSIVNQEISFEKASNHLSELLYNSVKKRLRGQVKIGSSFSGGLDSSIVVSIINQLKKPEDIPLEAFSALFPGYEKNEESSIKQLIAGKNIHPNFILPDSNAYEKSIDNLFYIHEEPFNSLSVIAQYFIYKEAREKNVIVLLDGQGADEVFGGYHHYFSTYFQALYRKNKRTWYNELQAYKKVNSSNSINAKINGSLLKQIVAKNFPQLMASKKYVQK